MLRHATIRLLQAVPLLLLISLISFVLLAMVPGDPAQVIARPDQIAQIRQNLGLDQPLHVQLGLFYLRLAHADLGRSLLLGQPVTDAILERAPVSIWIAVYSLVLTV